MLDPSPLDGCRAALLFHTAAHWGPQERTDWWNLTQTQEATTKNLCDFLRKCIVNADRPEEAP